MSLCMEVGRGDGWVKHTQDFPIGDQSYFVVHCHHVYFAKTNICNLM